MSASTRRSIVAALLGIGILGGLGPALPPLRAAPALPLRLPDRPLRLVRVLQRGVGEGNAAAITVKRSWDVQFERQARGIVANGQQTGAEVSAPPHLAALARIEQQRDASTMFPLMLAEDGAIISPAILPDNADAIGKALRAAEALIARQPVPADERAQLRYYLAEVHRAGFGLLDTLPPDLLFPSSAPVARSETVALPDGLTGHFQLQYSAVAQANAPWLARAERRVVTRVAGIERSAAEVWTLGQL